MHCNGKIYTIEELAETTSRLRAENKKVIHCHGVFDLLHIGHIRYLKQASQLGDILVVTLTPDHFVNKGPHRPVFSQDLRVEAIAALDCVDYVAVNEWPTAVETIHRLKPDIYAKGAEFKQNGKDLTNAINLEQEAITNVGGRLELIEDITFSSSHLLNQHVPVFSREVSEYLAGFSTRYTLNDVLGYLKRATNLNVLVIGEAMIDEYQYCETMGKSGKEPILATRYLSTEKFAGGILAVANHVAAFCDNVTLVSYLGGIDTQQDFINSQLNSTINPMFFYVDGVPTLVKRRFVETYPFQKLFEVYVMDNNGKTASYAPQLCKRLESILPLYDVVIVTDYGHNMITPQVVDVLCDKSKFLAVNTQVNADNFGFNTISKYHRADYICISGTELRLEIRSRRKDIKEVTKQVAEKLLCRNAVITQGNQGCVCYSQNEGFFEIPAFTNRIVDRVGAGDSVLAVTSLCAAQSAPMEVVGFIGNAVGAEAVATIGHKKFIEQVPLFRHIETLMK